MIKVIVRTAVSTRLLGAICLIYTALTEMSAWPACRSWAALALGLLLAVALTVHVVRHPKPVVAPWLFTVRPFRAGASGLVAYYTGFAVLLLGTTLLLTERWHFSTFRAALGIAPGPFAAGILSPFSGRLSGRFGRSTTLLAGAVVFAAEVWPLVAIHAHPDYPTVVLPSMLLWGTATALIQPVFFATADTVPSTELASGSAVLSMARQFGSALGVALLMTVLGMGGGLDGAWVVVVFAAGLTALAGRATCERRIPDTVHANG